LNGYFVAGRDIGSNDVFTEIAGQIGLDRDAVTAFLNSHEGAESVRVLERAAREKDIQGVPHFDIGGTVIVGAQPAGATRQAILRAAGQREQRPAA
jgi:predicted DsbA family dithiol-disulfide isomerase